MKKLTIIILAFILLFNTAGVTLAESEIKVVINGVEQSYSQAPVIKNGSTLVPMRGIFETLGANVNWDGSTKTVTAIKGATTITIVVDSKYAKVDGKQVTLSQSATIINGSTMVPLRFVSEALGADVSWDSNTKTVNIIQAADNEADSKELTIEEIVEQNDNKIVLVETEYSIGSGIVIDDGLILTNYHVVEGAGEAIITTVDDKIYNVEGIVVYDETADLAVLKTETKFGIEPVKFGNPNEVKKGEDIITIGNPEGFQNTVSTGIISGLREENGVNYIQITAPITFGSSGGALLNKEGEVIGVTTLGIADGNLNFAVSIDHISEWMSGILAQDFNSLTASFETDSTASIANQLEQLFNEEYLVMDFGDVSIELDYYLVFEDDVEIEIYGDLNEKEYLEYRKYYSNISRDIDKWSEMVAKTLDEMGIDKNIEVFISFYEFYEEEPTDLAFLEYDDYYYSYDYENWIVDRTIMFIGVYPDEIVFDSRK